jgi:hypothetical protein
MHVPTGLFLYGAYGTEENDDRFIRVNRAETELQEVGDGDHWFVKAGIRRTWNSLGATVFYGEYGRYNDMYGAFNCGGTVEGTAIGNACDVGLTVTGSELERYGFGIVQEIDAAAMSIWAKWVQLDGDIDFVREDQGRSKGIQDYEKLDNFLVGALINF